MGLKIVGPLTLGNTAFEGIPGTPFTFVTPTTNQVVQRNGSNIGTISISGATATGTLAIARAIPVNGFAGTQSNWQSVPISMGNVSGTIQAAPGWYTIEIKIYNGTTYISNQTMGPVGVGDLFITAGQSNATNYAQPLDTSVPVSAAVVSRGLSGGWAKAIDPQPTADNTFSSVWPRLGDAIFNHTGFPVGFISVGVGNTAISQWVPGGMGSNYPRINSALALLPGSSGFRAFLWHQGENDGALGTSQSAYTTALQSIIDQIRTDAGWTVPCGIAVATHPNESTGAGVIAAQIAVGTTYPTCFQGADTDTLGNTYRYDTVHFNTTTGTAAHANLWYNAIITYFGI